MLLVLTIDEELFDVRVSDLHVFLNFREADFTLRLCDLHEGEDTHFAKVGFVVQTELVDEFPVVLVERLISLKTSCQFLTS